VYIIPYKEHNIMFLYNKKPQASLLPWFGCSENHS